MKIRWRLFIAFGLLAGIGFHLLARWTIDDLRPRYLATMEESMVDTATVLAAWVSSRSTGATPAVDELRSAMQRADRRRFEAHIYEAVKKRSNVRVFVMDRAGLVRFDSRDGAEEGQDYSRWNDVVRTLRDEYGARATRTVPDDPATVVLHVAAPIRNAAGDTIGVLTVAKPADSVVLFVDTARRKIVRAAVLTGLAVLALALLTAAWITRPIQRLTAYARAVRDGRRAEPPPARGGEVGELTRSFEEMRTALEGRDYVTQYVQTLTHEMKSPLAALRGAAELLEEDLPPEDRARFLRNLRGELDRVGALIDRMLLLASLESRRALRDVTDVDLAAMARVVLEEARPAAAEHDVGLELDADAATVTVRGERFLLHHALANLLANAIAFSPQGKTVSVRVTPGPNGGAIIVVDDHGPGVPGYARDRVFERFYSLARPDTGRKSTGLGLAFVREVANLHGGTVRLDNRAEGGARATLELPSELET